MDDAALRSLAERLRSELATIIPHEAERDAITEQLDAAIVDTSPDGRDALLDAFGSHPATRAWLKSRAPVPDDVDRMFELLGGDVAVNPPYFICPNGDFDIVLDAMPATPPRCPNDGAEMVMSEG
jgi:hypothetical protein